VPSNEKIEMKKFSSLSPFEKKVKNNFINFCRKFLKIFALKIAIRLENKFVHFVGEKK
jgi:hypothetical protein